jgi:2-phosphosulfolactate phosphatase
VICAGQSDQFSLDDALCAGHLIAKVLDGHDGEHELNDAALAARMLAGGRKPTRRFLQETWGGRALMEIGLGDDLDICSELDRHDIVAEMRDRAITRAGS